MDRRNLGTSDLQVSELCLGTMQFGWTADEPSSFAVMDAFVEAGGNFLDSADIYSSWARGNRGGVSEEIIGRWLKERGNRQELVIATKVRGDMWDGADGEGLSRAHITRAAEGSLRRLQVDTIDLYQCHWPDDKTPIEETLDAFRELVGAGKVRYIGTSNYSAKQLAQALTAGSKNGSPRFVALQPHYNLVHRSEFEGALEALCQREGLGVIPYSPLAGGFLTGKYRTDSPLPESQRAGRARQYMTDQGVRVIDALAAIASARATTLPAVALAWLLSRPAVTAPIIGANSPEQLAALLPAAALGLSDEERGSLEAASKGM
ncbi:MAG: aldo/keto reductase [Dehalococcoidia bacterium]|nr:aldo/keto reductase [Dehalococcoidia bacterium]MDZ4277972.1 aldo/keto reductase [Dehalococcoidia bacterium]